MGLFLQILKIVGFVLLGIIAVFVVLLFVQVNVEIDYRQQLSVKARVLFVRFSLYPKRKKKQKDVNESDRSEQTQNKPMSAQTVLDMLSPVSSAARWLLRRLRISDIVAVYPVYDEDAAKTALTCGRINAVGGAALAFLQNIFIIDIKQYSVIPDFQNEYGEAKHLFCRIHAMLLVLLIAVLIFFKRYAQAQNAAVKETVNEPR